MSAVTSSLWVAWLSLAVSALVILAYEVRIRHRSRHNPMIVARTAHAWVRAAWVRSLMSRPGNEILAVQTIRNGVMSTTIIGSTAALALMGTVSLTGTKFDFAATEGLEGLLHPTPRMVLVGVLIGVLFATFVLSLMAVRFYNHVGYMMSTVVAEERRPALIDAAERYMVHAGNYYSMSMRSFLWVAPVAAGLVNPLLMPLASLALVRVLVWFDRAPVEWVQG